MGKKRDSPFSAILGVTFFRPKKDKVSEKKKKSIFNFKHVLP